MSNLSNFRPNRENKGVQIDMVRCDTYSSNFESLYNTYTTYYEENPNGSWFPEFQRGSVWSQEQKEQYRGIVALWRPHYVEWLADWRFLS